MRRPSPTVVWLVGLLLLLVLGRPAAAEPLYADTTINGTAAGVVTFERDGARLTVPKTALAAMGLAPPVGGAPMVDLTTLARVSYSFDAARQTVAITADPAALIGADYSASHDDSRRPDRPAWGGLLNYSYYAVAQSDGHVSSSAMGEVRVFGPVGVLRSTFVARSDPGPITHQVQRLDTTLAFDDIGATRQILVGDFITSGPSWTRSVRAAGFSIGTDFGLRPDLITAPMPRIVGASATPTTLDVYVDNVQRYRTKGQAGPFTISDLPMVDGRGQVRLVVTDILGRQSYQSFNFYAASSLLRAGLSAYAFEGGFLREDFAAWSDRYTDGFLSFAGRRGLTDWATVETNLVVSGKVQNAGFALTAKAGEEALIAAAFNLDGQGRVQAYASARRDMRNYSLFASAQYSDPGFRDLASRTGAATGGRQIQMGASTSVGWGSLAATYSRQSNSETNLGLFGLSWSKGVRNLNVYANAFVSHGSSRRQVFTIGFSLPFGKTGSVSSSINQSVDGTHGSVSAQSTPRGETGWGWRASADAGTGRSDPSRLEAEVRRADRWGEMGAGAYVGPGGVSGRVYGSGSVVFLDAKPRLAARVGEGFGLVDVGEPGVEITVENRSMGKTGADGRLFLAQLAPLAPSVVALRPENVSLDRQIMVASAEIRPTRGAGSVVRLPVRKVRSALLRLVDLDGEPIPTGSAAFLDGVAATPVGYDGALYLTDITDQSQVVIQTPDGACSAEVPHEQTSKALVHPEALVCRPDPGGVIRADSPPDQRRDAGAGGAELHGERDGELRDVRPKVSFGENLARFCRHALHLHFGKLRRAALHDRDPSG